MVLAGKGGEPVPTVRPGNEASVTLVKTASKTEIPRVRLWPERRGSKGRR